MSKLLFASILMLFLKIDIVSANDINDLDINDRFRNLIGTEMKKDYFANSVGQIDRIMEAHRGFIDHPTPIAKERFIRECNAILITQFLHWIQSDIVSKKSDSFLHRLVDDSDLRTFVPVAKDLVLIYTKATYAHALCVNVQNNTEEVIDTTLKRDLSDMEKNMQEMMRQFEGFNYYIKTQFWQRKARKMIQIYMAETTGWGVNEQADYVLRKLESKYFWRAWIVISFNENENRPPGDLKYYYNTDNSYSGYFFDSIGRGLFVGSRDRILRQIPPGIDKIITKSCFKPKPSSFYPRSNMPGENWDYIDECWTKSYVNGEYCAIGTRALGKILKNCKPEVNDKDLEYKLFVVIRNDDKIAVKYSKSGNQFNGYGFGLIHRKLGYFNRSFKPWYAFVWWAGGTDYLATPMYAYVWKSYSMVFFYNYKL